MSRIKKSEYKTCTYCGKNLPATTEYFARVSAKPDHKNVKLRTQCKDCLKVKQNERRRRQSEDPNFHTYYDKNKLKMLVQNINFRTNGNVLVSDIENVFQEYRDINGALRCIYCNREITDDKMLHLDHFISVKLGGKSIPENIVPACRYCNRSKWDEDVILWYKNQLFFNEIIESKLLQKYQSIKQLT